MFEIIYENSDKKPLRLNERDLKEWLCEKVFQQKWYGKNGLYDTMRFCDENGSNEEQWEYYTDEILDDLVYDIKINGEMSSLLIDGYEYEGPERPSFIIKLSDSKPICFS